jgi:hypothetical protein
VADESFLPPSVPLMSAVKARDIARSCQGMANHLRAQGVESGTVRLLEQRSAWWMAYSIALSQIPPGRVDMDGAP